MANRRFALTLVACCVVPAMSVRAQDVVELIPGDTLGYVVINRLADTDKKIQAMGQRMKLPIPSLVAMAKTQSRIANGVDDTGSICLVFLPTSAGPSAVLYVPVDDYAAFIEQLEPEGTEDNITAGRLMGRPVIVGKKISHAVVAWPNNRTLLQKVLSDEATGQNTPDILDSLQADHDITAVLSADGVKVLTSLGRKGLEEAKAVLRKQSGEDNPALAGIEVYVQLLKAIEAEVAAFAGGLKLEEGGALRVNEWVWVQPTGKIAPILRDMKPYDGDLLAGLPNIPYVVAFGGFLPSGAVEPMMDFSRNMMKAMPQLYGLTPEQVDRMMDLAVKYFPDLHGMSFLLGVGQEDGPLYSEMLGAMQVSDAPAYVANYRKYWTELDDVIGEAEGSFLKDAEVEDVKMDDLSVLKISMPIPGLQGLKLPNQGELDALMEKFYGPGGLTMYVAAANENTVLMAYTEMALLRAAVQAITDGTKQISRDRHIVATSKHLPAGAHMVGYWSPSGTIAFANRMLRLMSGAEEGIQLPAFPDTPPVGWAMTATPSVVKFNTVVPAEISEAAGSFVEQVKQLDRERPSDE